MCVIGCPVHAYLADNPRLAIHQHACLLHKLDSVAHCIFDLHILHDSLRQRRSEETLKVSYSPFALHLVNHLQLLHCNSLLGICPQRNDGRVCGIDTQSCTALSGSYFASDCMHAQHLLHKYMPITKTN